MKRQRWRACNRERKAGTFQAHSPPAGRRCPFSPLGVEEPAQARAGSARQGPLAIRKAAPFLRQIGPERVDQAHSQRLQAALGGLPPLNMWVRTAPSGAGEFCWHVDIVPRLAQLAGLEMGTGVSLNIVPPEQAAAALRDAT